MTDIILSGGSPMNKQEENYQDNIKELIISTLRYVGIIERIMPDLITAVKSMQEIAKDWETEE